MKTSLVSFMSLFTLIFSPAVFAEDEVASCAKAKITSAPKCDEVKVKFDLSECGGSQKTLTAQVVCDKNKGTATVEHKGYSYSTGINQSWGDNWVLSGGIKRKSLKGAPAAEAAPAPSAASAPAAAPAASVAAAPATATALKFSGFADLRHTSYSVSKDDPNLTKGRAESGFGVEDGAFYLNYEKEKVSFVADIPFRRFKDKDLNSTATVGEQSQLSTIAFGVDKAQLFVKYKVKEGLNFSIGQFDTIFGVELNDSKDRFFGKTGLVYDLTLPVTHTGIMFDYTSNGIYTKLFAANALNRGSYTSSSTDDSDEFGLAIGFSGEMFRGQAGYMGRAVQKADASANRETRSLTDLTFGLTSGLFAVDFEYAIVKDPGKNTLTSANNADLENSGTGAFVLVSYKANDDLSFGLRYDKVENDPAYNNTNTAATVVKSGTDTGLSVHYKLSSDLELRSDYITYNYQNLNDFKWTNSRFYIGTLFTF